MLVLGRAYPLGCGHPRGGHGRAHPPPGPYVRGTFERTTWGVVRLSPWGRAQLPMLGNSLLSC